MNLFRSKRAFGWMVILLVSLFNMQHVMADKITPTIDISQTSFGGDGEPETYLSDKQFEEPVITVYEDAGQTINITNRFFFSYAMQGGTESIDSEKKMISTDPVTGTYVYARYGEVVTGSKFGTATVLVTITPLEKYQDRYNSTNCSYTIKLNKVSATATRICPTAEIWKAANNYTLAYPTFSLSYKNKLDKDIDVSSHYDITATTNSNLITLDNTNKRIKTADTEGTADIKFHFAPKSDTYEAVEDQTLTLNIVHLDKITPQLIFPEEGDSAYFGNRDTPCLIPTVLDDFGNDLSWMTTQGSAAKKGQLLLAWGAAPLKEGATMHTTPTYDSNTLYEEPVTYQAPEAGKVIQKDSWSEVPRSGVKVINQLIETGNPAYYENVPKNEFETYDLANADKTAKIADYQVKIYCQLYPELWNEQAKKRFNKVETSYPFKVMTRKNKLVIEPDPTYIKFTKGEKMNINNRFEVNALHVSTVDDTQMGLKKGEEFWLRHTSQTKEDGMNYTIKFRSDEAKIEGYVGGDDNIKTITEDGVEYTVLWSTKGWSNDDNWTLTFLKTGKINLEYAVYPYNYHWEGDGYGKINITYDVIDKIQPKVVETPNPIILYTTDTELSSQPEVTITNQIGEDIKKYYDVKFVIDEDNHGITFNEETGKFEVNSLTKGEVNVKVIATPKEEGTVIFDGKERPIKEIYEAGETSFKFIIKELEEGQTRFAWDIIDTQSDNKGDISDQDKDHGKLYFTKAGIANAGYTIDAIPGLAVKMGNEKDEDWTAQTDNNGRIYVSGDAVTINQKGIPTNGTYYELTPHTNGFLTLDAHFAKNNKIVIISQNGKEKQTFKPSSDFIGELGDASWQYAKDKTVGYPHDNTFKFFRYPLMAGETYYLYNDGDETTREPLYVYGINFLPAFINQQTDHMPITTATAFANGYAGALPMLTAKNMRGHGSVTYKKAGCKKQEVSRITDELDEYAEINETLGTITPKKGTVKMMNAGSENITVKGHKALSTVADRIKIYAEVKSNYKPNVVKTPFYDLMISDIPTFIMPDNYVPSVGEIVSTTNYPTRIKAHFGGWKKADDRPYYKNNDKTKGLLTDSWKVSKLDSVGASNRTVDYFTYSSFGGQNATTELVKSYKYDSSNEDMTYQVPCRGTYIRFEPEERGTLVVYILQNGMITYDGDKEKLSNTSKNYDKIKISPVYITDEKGLPVKLQPWSISNLDEASTGTEAYTEGIINCDYNTWKNDCNGGKECTTNNMSASSQDEKDYTLDLLKRLEYVSTNSKWKMRDQEQVIDVAKVLGKGVEGSMGYTVISKAYTRYSFKVEAGKTYFVFMNGSKLGNGGFAFMPEDWTPDRAEDAVNVQNVTLDENGNDDLAKAEDGKTAKVKLYHKFVNGRWNSLCVPFSINQTQFKKVFGENALAISFDKFEKNDTIDGKVYTNVAHFTQHSYHWIVAGRPYFILPDKVQAKTDDNGRLYVEFDSVTIEKGIAPMHLKEQKASAEFNFNGNFEPAVLSKGDYAIASYENGEAMLYELPEDMQQLGYRAYIKTTPVAVATQAKLFNFSCNEIIEGSGNEETTGIEPIFELPKQYVSGKKKDGIYTLDGIKVGTSEQLDNLPNDIYIVKGKKVCANKQ